MEDYIIDFFFKLSLLAAYEAIMVIVGDVDYMGDINICLDNDANEYEGVITRTVFAAYCACLTAMAAVVAFIYYYG